MPTQREYISLTRGKHRLLGDAVMSNRLILAELKSNSKLLIKRDTDRRKLWMTDTIFTTIPCLEMIPVPLSECCEYTSPCIITRSKHQLPAVGEGIFQYMIKSVMNITRTKRFTEITPERYINILKLKIRKDETYYWIQNRYLYTTSEDLEAVRAVLYLEDDLPDNLLYPDCDACKSKVEPHCTNPYDLEFKAPGYLQKPIIDLTSQSLLGTYFKIPEDKTINDSDDQVNKT